MHGYRSVSRASILSKALYLLCLGTAVSILTIVYTQERTNAYQKQNEPPQKKGKIVIATLPHKDKEADQSAMWSSCKQKHCSEYLTNREKVALKKCLREVFRHMDPSDIKMHLKENNCRFVNGTQRLPVALVSAEGSGNTWIRGLLERATGICTGFIHCDYVMRQSGFIGEGVKSGTVLVVKTHAIEPQWNGVEYSSPNPRHPFFGSAILIVRNPYHSLVAEWNRRVTNLVLIPNGIEHNESHTNTIPEEYWRGSEWDAYIRVYVQAWKERIVNWLLQDHANTHVVYYEDLKRNPTEEVIQMMDFLGLEYNIELVKERISDDYAEFKRPRPSKSTSFEYYTVEQKQYIKSVILETNELLVKRNTSLKLGRYCEQ